MIRILPKSKKLMALVIASIAVVGGGAAAVSAEQGQGVAISKVTYTGERIGIDGKNQPYPIQGCVSMFDPASCYLVKMGPGGSMVQVGAGPIACPIWYWDGTAFRPRSVQSGCVTTTGSFDLYNYPIQKFFQSSTLADKRCTSQGCFQRQLSEVYVAGANRVLTSYAPGVNTWVKIGDPPK
jgi:hypothetical protein